VQKSPGLGELGSSIHDAIDALRVVANALGAQIVLEQSSHPAFHPGRCARVLVRGVDVGIVGELLPSVARERDIPSRVSVFDIDGDRVLATLGETPHEAHPLSVFPAATQDVSLVVDVSLSASDVRATLTEGVGELLESLTVVDDYRGDGVPDGHKSLTFALRFRAADRTLTQAEATEAKDAGVALAAQRHGATLRA
jgi:phenylalanyl-tRNA synthetase beta chain